MLILTAFVLVPGTGVEPVRLLGPQDFKSCVSTNSTTQAVNESAKAHHSLQAIKKFNNLNFFNLHWINVIVTFISSRWRVCFSTLLHWNIKALSNWKGFERKTGFEPATSTLARSRSTNWATFAILFQLFNQIQNTLYPELLPCFKDGKVNIKFKKIKIKVEKKKLALRLGNQLLNLI